MKALELNLKQVCDLFLIPSLVILCCFVAVAIQWESYLSDDVSLWRLVMLIAVAFAAKIWALYQIEEGVFNRARWLAPHIPHGEGLYSLENRAKVAALLCDSIRDDIYSDSYGLLGKPNLMSIQLVLHDSEENLKSGEKEYLELLAQAG